MYNDPGLREETTTEWLTTISILFCIVTAIVLLWSYGVDRESDFDKYQQDSFLNEQQRQEVMGR